MTNADFVVENHGSILLLGPQNDTAKQWVNDNIGTDETQMFAGKIVVEPRYIDDIIVGIESCGMTVVPA